MRTPTPLRRANGLVSTSPASGERIGVDQFVGALNVSRTPIREALVRLKADRLAVNVAFARPPRIAATRWADFSDLHTLRFLLQPNASAAPHVTDQQLQELHASVADHIRGGFVSY
jgi:DNA-binding GntR family transcriptional regulator